MKVYIIFDPLLERVVCVHEEEGVDCPECKVRKTNSYGYGLEQLEREVYPSRITNRNNKLNELGIK